MVKLLWDKPIYSFDWDGYTFISSPYKYKNYNKAEYFYYSQYFDNIDQSFLIVEKSKNKAWKKLLNLLQE